MKTTARQHRRFWDISALLAVLVGLGWLYAGFIDTEVIGFTRDDGIYLVTAKALAQGQGFTLINLAEQIPQAKYPIFYPLTLAAAWLLQPDFPGNLVALNVLSIAYMLLAFGVLFFYLRDCRRQPLWLVLLVVLLSATGYYTMYFGATLMSEALYLLLSLFTVFYAERFYAPKMAALATDRETLAKAGLIALAPLVLLSVLTFHTRILGLTLILAVFLWLLARKHLRHAGLYLASSLLLTVGPWYAWVKFATPATLSDIAYPLYAPYINYGEEFLRNFYEITYWYKLLQSLGGFVGQLADNMFLVLSNFPSMYPSLAPSKHNVAGSWAYVLGFLALTYSLFGYFVLRTVNAAGRIVRERSLASLSIPALYSIIYIGVTLLWNYETQFTRFLIVILPFLWFYLFQPFVGVLQQSNRFRRILAVSGITAIALLGFASFPDAAGLVRKSRQEHWIEIGQYPWLWQDYKATFRYIRENLPPSVPLAADGELVFYLYTDHPGYHLHYYSLRRGKKGYDLSSTRFLLPSMQHYGVRYMIVEPHMISRQIVTPHNPIAVRLLKQYPERFKHRYTSPRGAISLYEILPPQAAGKQPI